MCKPIILVFRKLHEARELLQDQGQSEIHSETSQKIK